MKERIDEGIKRIPSEQGRSQVFWCRWCMMDDFTNTTTSQRGKNVRRRKTQPKAALCWNICGVLALGMFLLVSDNVILEQFSPYVGQGQNLVFASRSQQDTIDDYDHHEKEESIGDITQGEETRSLDMQGSRSNKMSLPTSNYIEDDPNDATDESNKQDDNDKNKNKHYDSVEKATYPTSQELQSNISIKDPLERSKRQQRKFDTRKDLLEATFDQSMRYYVDLFEFGANIVNEEWAYVHIFKNGGTTIEVQTGHDHTSLQDPQVQRRKWFTLVRDPIDHFLSGWAECAHRERQQQQEYTRKATGKNHLESDFSLPIPSNTTVQESYDLRVNRWIDAVTVSARPDIEADCEIHSFPQINSLLDPHGHLSYQLQVVGDLSELPAVLESIGFSYNASLDSGRNASSNKYLQTYFPKRQDWLSSNTMQRLCNFLAMDYFLFDFDMPSMCNKTHPHTTVRQDTIPLALTNTTALQDLGRELEHDNVQNRTKSHLSFRDLLEQQPSLRLSQKQHESYERRKDRLSSIFSIDRRFRANGYEWAANIVNDHWAYLHIFKNAGTTVAAQTKRNHVPLLDRQVQQRQLFTVVRDPLEHFLSGWSECGDRQYKGRRNQMQQKYPNTTIHPNDVPIPDELLKLDYDTRIQRWLIQTRKFARSGHAFVCEIHSFPQVNYMLTVKGTLLPSLQLVGDLQELPAVFHSVGFQYNHKLAAGRNATSNSFLQTYYPKREDLLSNATIRELCDFLAIDYYLLDYPLPEACHDMPLSGYTKWTTNNPLPKTKTKGTTTGAVQNRISKLVPPKRLPNNHFTTKT